MKTFTQTVQFDATPAELYELYADSKKHAAATGAAAKISRKVGGAFEAWDGSLTGKNLLLRKGEMIVQTWRGSDWKKSDPDSILVLLFRKSAKGASVTITHANVPDSESTNLQEGWREYYWKPWAEYLRRT